MHTKDFDEMNFADENSVQTLFRLSKSTLLKRSANHVYSYHVMMSLATSHSQATQWRHQLSQTIKQLSQ